VDFAVFKPRIDDDRMPAPHKAQFSGGGGRDRWSSGPRTCPLDSDFSGHGSFLDSDIDSDIENRSRRDAEVANPIDFPFLFEGTKGSGRIQEIILHGVSGHDSA
jgi:hypothetical protein